MFEAYAADGDTEFHMGYASEHQFCCKLTPNVHFDQQQKRKVGHDQHRMIDLGAGDLNRNIDKTSNIRARAANSDDVGGRVVELSNRGPVRQEFVQSSAQHRKR